MIAFARFLIKHFPINSSLNGSSDSYILQSKMKYFRLCLSYKVRSERYERDPRETWTRKMKIKSL